MQDRTSIRPDPENGNKNGEESDDDSFGPALPPHLLAMRKKQKTAAGEGAPQRRARPAGPAMPPVGYTLDSAARNDDSDDDYGPAPPPQNKDEDDELQSRIAEIEARARKAREEAEVAAAPQKLERGDWMTVPPEVKKIGAVGLDNMKSRQFSKTAVQSEVDQSGWTETPTDRKRAGEKRKKREDDGPRPPTQEEILTQEYIRKHNEKHRPASLMDTHVVNYVSDPAKAQSDDASKRGFDRDRDLSARRADPKARQDMLQRAKELDGKFLHGAKTFL
ncbi:hypothetical protein HK104_004011 [Borealophlyctis nickersoniae]|nr:hypothetical protein HK104_004011 [Borealophlyctis nickersoniae]